MIDYPTWMRWFVSLHLSHEIIMHLHINFVSITRPVPDSQAVVCKDRENSREKRKAGAPNEDIVQNHLT